jgi:hypoxanthine-DNA glycosylase
MNKMTEKHPFSPFVPPESRYLILGSFPGRKSTREFPADDWYYGSKYNQFWKIIELVYGLSLPARAEKEALFQKLGIALSDIIFSCERSVNTNADSNLTNITYNTEIVDEILASAKIEKILFTGKGVYQKFLKHFKVPENIALIVLPSPSPAFARMNINAKAKEYKKHMPDL